MTSQYEVTEDLIKDFSRNKFGGGGGGGRGSGLPKIVSRLSCVELPTLPMFRVQMCWQRYIFTAGRGITRAKAIVLRGSYDNMCVGVV